MLIVNRFAHISHGLGAAGIFLVRGTFSVFCSLDSQELLCSVVLRVGKIKLEFDGSCIFLVMSVQRAGCLKSCAKQRGNTEKLLNKLAEKGI